MQPRQVMQVGKLDSRRVPGSLPLALIPVAALAVSGCAAVEGIFKAGVWTGVIVVAIVLAVAFGLVRMLNR